jgi:DNA-directed RNA polymerase subunit L
MKINVLNRSENELRIEIAGEGHSFCNTLQSALLKDNSIEFVGYNISHPLVGQPIIYIRTKGKRRPEEALIDGAKTLEKELDIMEKTFKKAFKCEEV